MHSNASLRVIARATARREHCAQVRGILSALVEPTRREPGCLRYELLVKSTDPTEFVFVEEWANAEAEQRHFITPHVTAALQQLAGLLVAEPEIQRYHIVQ